MLTRTEDQSFNPPSIANPFQGPHPRGRRQRQYEIRTSGEMGTNKRLSNSSTEKSRMASRPQHAPQDRHFMPNHANSGALPVADPPTPPTIHDLAREARGQSQTTSEQNARHGTQARAQDAFECAGAVSLMTIYHEATERSMNWVARTAIGIRSRALDKTRDGPSCYQFKSRELLEMAKEIASNQEKIRVPGNILSSLQSAIRLRKLSNREHKAANAPTNSAAIESHSHFIDTLQRIHQVLSDNRPTGAGECDMETPDDDGEQDFQTMRTFFESTEQSECRLEITDEPDAEDMACWCLLRQLLQLARYGDTLWQMAQFDLVEVDTLFLIICSLVFGMAELFEDYKSYKPKVKTQTDLWKLLDFSQDQSTGDSRTTGRYSDRHDILRLACAPSVRLFTQYNQYRANRASHETTATAARAARDELEFSILFRAAVSKEDGLTSARMDRLVEILRTQVFRELIEDYDKSFAVDQMAAILRRVPEEGDSELWMPIAWSICEKLHELGAHRAPFVQVETVDIKRQIDSTKRAIDTLRKKPGRLGKPGAQHNHTAHLLRQARDLAENLISRTNDDSYRRFSKAWPFSMIVASNNVRIKSYKAGIQFCNVSNVLVSTILLYRACLSEDLLPVPWRDMEHVIQIHGEVFSSLQGVRSTRAQLAALLRSLDGLQLQPKASSYGNMGVNKGGLWGSGPTKARFKIMERVGASDFNNGMRTDRKELGFDYLYLGSASYDLLNAICDAYKMESKVRFTTAVTDLLNSKDALSKAAAIIQHHIHITGQAASEIVEIHRQRYLASRMLTPSILQHVVNRERELHDLACLERQFTTVLQEEQNALISKKKTNELLHIQSTLGSMDLERDMSADLRDLVEASTQTVNHLVELDRRSPHLVDKTISLEQRVVAGSSKRPTTVEEGPTASMEINSGDIVSRWQRARAQHGHSVDQEFIDEVKLLARKLEQ